MTEVDSDGKATSHWLCPDHASEFGVSGQWPDDERVAAHGLPPLRSLVKFIRDNSRMPSDAELEQIGYSGSLSDILPGTQQFSRQLDYLEQLVEFLERHSRFPTDEELPDPLL